MPRTKKPEVTRQLQPQSAAVNGPSGGVLTLAEAAAYLRLSEQDVLQLVREQELPARQVGTDWRFLKRAIEDWLSKPLSQVKKEGIWAFAGAWKDDPHAEEMLKEIMRNRGRTLPED
jgi:excisionase family DNA binding protein